jgi:hypothetical protein
MENELRIRTLLARAEESFQSFGLKAQMGELNEMTREANIGNARVIRTEWIPTKGERTYLLLVKG